MKRIGKRTVCLTQVACKRGSYDGLWSGNARVIPVHRLLLPSHLLANTLSPLIHLPPTCIVQRQ